MRAQIAVVGLRLLDGLLLGALDLGLLAPWDAMMRRPRSSSPGPASSKTSSSAPSKRSAQRCAPLVSVDQLAGDAHAVAGLAHAAFEHVAHAKLAADLPDVERLALVGEARIAGDDEQRLEARQRR